MSEQKAENRKDKAQFAEMAKAYMKDNKPKQRLAELYNIVKERYSIINQMQDNGYTYEQISELFQNADQITISAGTLQKYISMIRAENRKKAEAKEERKTKKAEQKAELKTEQKTEKAG